MHVRSTPNPVKPKGAGATIHGSTAVAVAPSGDVYVGDSQGTVTRIHADGRFVSKWSLPAVYGRVESLTVASDGTVFGTVQSRPFKHTADGTTLVGDQVPGCVNPGPHQSGAARGIAVDATHEYVGRACTNGDVYDRSLNLLSSPQVAMGRWPVVDGITLYTTDYDYLSGRSELSESTIGDPTILSYPVRSGGGSFPTAFDDGTFVRVKGDYMEMPPFPLLIDKVDGTAVGEITGTGATYLALAHKRLWYVTGADDVRVIPLAPGAPTPTIYTPDDEIGGYASRVRTHRSLVHRRARASRAAPR